jgi:hypothetical protein
MKTEASQSSSKRGSSSPSDFNFGNLVDKRAKCVVSDKRGSGYESGWDSSRIYARLVGGEKRVLTCSSLHLNKSSNEISH